MEGHNINKIKLDNHSVYATGQVNKVIFYNISLLRPLAKEYYIYQNGNLLYHTNGTNNNEILNLKAKTMSIKEKENALINYETWVQGSMHFFLRQELLTYDTKIIEAFDDDYIYVSSLKQIQNYPLIITGYYHLLMVLQ